MRELFLVFLFLHVTGAIVAFGPTFAYPLIGAAGRRDPMHANFAARLIDTISRRLVLPLALVQGITGLGLIWSASFDVLKTHWLLLAIVLYLVTLAFAIFVQTPAVGKLIELTTRPASGLPPGPGVPPPAGGPVVAAPGGPAAADGSGGPPPGVREAAGRIQRGGILLSVLILSIVALMVVKPAF